MAEDDSDIHHAHDKLFKAGFSDPSTAAAFLQSQLSPAIVSRIDWLRLQLQPGSFIDSQFRASESDLLFSAPLAGRPSLLYLLFEHQTTHDSLLPLRLLRYMVRIWENHLKAHDSDPSPKLPVILPIVLAQNAEVWNIDPHFAKLLDIPPDLACDLQPHIPDFLFHFIQLAEIPFEDIRGTPAGILILRTMKAERLSQLLADPVWDESLIVQLPRETFELLLRYILAADIDKTAFVNKVQAIQHSPTRHRAMTLAQQFRQEGRQEGHQEGRLEGRQEGEVSLTLRLLRRKFPRIAAEAESLVRQLDEERLLAFGEALLFFEASEDCLDWLKSTEG